MQYKPTKYTFYKLIFLFFIYGTEHTLPPTRLLILMRVKHFVLVS